jgi:hypothetical protein
MGGLDTMVNADEAEEAADCTLHHPEKKSLNMQSVVENDAVLHVVFSMLGTKAWLLVAGVNRQWRDLYAAAVQLSRETSARHIMASVTSYEYAKHCGRDSTSDGEARLLGELAGVDVVYRYAEETQVATTVAAGFKSGRADMLQLLHVLSPYLRPGPTCDTSLLCWPVLLGQLECLRFLTTAVGAHQGSHHIEQSAR